LLFKPPDEYVLNFLLRSLWMVCPKCGDKLTKKYYKGMMEVDYCPSCRGMWLDFDELDKLEDVVFDEDHYKGSLIHHECDVACKCPVCDGQLQEFQYRLYDLRLDNCPAKHGFWLDAGEDERVLEIMRTQHARIDRKKEAEADWKQVLQGLHSFINKI
jgi:Zn-finger nucleic acid-binding protein